MSTLSTHYRRRAFLNTALTLGAWAITSPWLVGCDRTASSLRVSTHPWPPYELLHVSAQTGNYSRDSIQLVEVPSATASLQLLSSGNAEAATLTLDEVISARVENMPLTVIALIDVSSGADMLLAAPQIKQLSDLKGRRIGVEQSAVGAVMLHAALEKADMKIDDVSVVYATVDEHVALFKQGAFDALVTYQPIPQQLDQGSFSVLFDSSEVLGRIVDVLVATPQAIETQPSQLRTLVAGYFQARQLWQTNPAQVAPLVAPRLQISIAQVSEAFHGLELPDLAENRAWLDPAKRRLLKVADQLQNVMRTANLLRTTTNLEGLVDHRFLPGR